LEQAGLISWQHRLTRIRVRERDLFGRWTNRWRLLRSSNCYQIRLPGEKVTESENRSETQNQILSGSLVAPLRERVGSVETALISLRAAIEARNRIEQEAA